ISTIQKGVDQIDALPLYALSVRDDALDTLSLVADLFLTKSALIATQATAAAARDDLAGQTYQGAIAEVAAHAGTDLHDLELPFYNTPVLWYAIAKYNGLSTSKVPALPDGPSDIPGRLIRIPQQSGAVKAVGDVC